MSHTPYRGHHVQSKWGGVASALGRGIAQVAEINYREKMESERLANMERLRLENKKEREESLAREDKRYSDTVAAREKSERNAANRHAESLYMQEKRLNASQENKKQDRIYNAFNKNESQQIHLSKQLDELESKFKSGELEIDESAYRNQTRQMAGQLKTLGEHQNKMLEKHSWLQDYATRVAQDETERSHETTFEAGHKLAQPKQNIEESKHKKGLAEPTPLEAIRKEQADKVKTEKASRRKLEKEQRASKDIADALNKAKALGKAATKEQITSAMTWLNKAWAKSTDSSQKREIEILIKTLAAKELKAKRYKAKERYGQSRHF